MAGTPTFQENQISFFLSAIYGLGKPGSLVMTAPRGALIRPPGFSSPRFAPLVIPDDDRDQEPQIHHHLLSSAVARAADLHRGRDLKLEDARGRGIERWLMLVVSDFCFSARRTITS